MFGSVGDDAEFAERVRRHQADRPESFALVEAADSRTWVDRVDPGALLLLDCLGTLVGMVMSEEWPAEETGVALLDAGSDLPPGYAARVEARVADAVGSCWRVAGDTIVVTNEVGDGVVPAYGSGRLFRDVLGRANRSLVGAADRSYLAVCGRLVDLSDQPVHRQLAGRLIRSSAVAFSTAGRPLVRLCPASDRRDTSEHVRRAASDASSSRSPPPSRPPKTARGRGSTR